MRQCEYKRRYDLEMDRYVKKNIFMVKEYQIYSTQSVKNYLVKR